MAQEAGLAVLLQDVDSGSASFRHLRAFGLLYRTCHPDQVLRDTHEILARAIHEDYLRQQADDLGAKLKAVQCSAAPLLDWDEPFLAFTPGEIERLARMEHDRWMIAKRKEGWRHGPKKDNDAKTHPCLLLYDELPSDEQDKDGNAVRQIPAMLVKVGFRVHRLSARQNADGRAPVQ